MPVVSIVVAGNSGFIVPLTVCVRSIVEHAPHASLTVLDCGLTSSDLDLLRRTAAPAVHVRFVKVVDHDFNSLPHPICGSWATYARLLIGDLPLDSSIVLYLDADAMLLQDVSALFVEDLAKMPVAAVREMYTPTFASENGIAEWNELNLLPTTPYFNAGVMLINIPIWNSLSIKEQAFTYLRTPGRSTRLFDQEALNFAINGRWRELEPVWNVTRYWYRPERRLGKYTRILEEARILHFLSEAKPWLPGTSIPTAQARLFFDCLDRTELAGWRPNGKNDAVIQYY